MIRSFGYNLMVLMFVVLAPRWSMAQQPSGDAPLGLRWGSNLADMKASGIEVKEHAGTDFGTSFALSKLSKALSDQAAALGSFGYDDKLWRVVIISKDFPEDPTGSTVLARYNELSAILAEKYGKPRQVHQVGDSIYAEQKNFIYGINNGRTNWFSNFDNPQLFIQLGVIADNMSNGKWRIIYENKLLKKDFEASRKLKEKGTL
jgi:hypothetical protein